MKKLLQKDKQNRNVYNKLEVNKLVLQSIIRNNNFSKLIKLKSCELLFEIANKGSKVTHINRCVLTGRKKRIHKLYSFSRISFLKLARNGYIYGLQKSSW